MGKLRVLLLLPLVVCSALAIASAQNATTLKPGTPLERTLGPGQVHEFTVNMEENDFAQLVVDQRGIDVFIKVSSPAGKTVGEFDTPNGSEGEENVSFVALTAGTYRIAITPLDADAQTTGRYQIKLVEVRGASDQEVKYRKNLDGAKAKGIALLSELDSTIPQIKSPYTRIQAQLQAAQLLSQVDEKRASKHLADAVAGMKEFLATADTESEEYLQQYQFMSQLRGEIVRILGERDPDAALAFIRSSTPRSSPYASAADLATQESALELSVADQIMVKDPNRAAQLAKQNLKKGYSSNLVITVSQLAQTKPELAAELVHEMATKLLSEERLTNNSDAANLAVSLLYSNREPENAVQIHVSSIAAPTRGGLLTEDEYKQLLQKSLDEILSYSQSTARMYSHSRPGILTLLNGLKSLGTEVDKLVGGSSEALKKKEAELTGAPNIEFNPYVEFQNVISNTPLEAAFEAIEKAPADMREILYVQLANREAGNGDTAKARQIVNEHVSNQSQRNQALKSIEQQELNKTVTNGKVEDALRAIAAVRKPSERAAQLIQLVSQINEGQNRAATLSLLEQARNLLGTSPQAQDQNQMNALFEIAKAFSRYDTKRSFEIVDPLIDQFNELCAAAHTLQGFGAEFFDDDELDMQSGGTVGEIANQIGETLGNLALANFDRAKASADKIRLPEVRVKVYLEIAQQTITSNLEPQPQRYEGWNR